MNRFLLIVLLVMCRLAAYAQQTEFSFQAGSGLFSFGGPGSASETSFDISDVASIPDKLANPYGRNSGFSYGLTEQVQRITKSGMLYGTQAGYESMTSRISIIQISIEGPSINGGGSATVRNQYINLYPFIGKRLSNHRVSLDVTTGIDLGIGLSMHERIQFNGSPLSFSLTDQTRSLPAIDVRPRLNLVGNYRAFGLSIGYSHGLSAYTSGSYSTEKVYARMWRVGLVYRLVKRV